MAIIDFDKTILVAFDFDGTLTLEDAYGEDFELDKEALDWVRLIQRLPVKTCLWSCRHDNSLNKAVEALRKEGIEFNYINEDNGLRNSGRKINVDVYIDDKANDGIISWSAIYNRIKNLLDEKGGQ